MHLTQTHHHSHITICRPSAIGHPVAVLPYALPQLWTAVLPFCRSAAVEKNGKKNERMQCRNKVMQKECILHPIRPIIPPSYHLIVSRIPNFVPSHSPTIPIQTRFLFPSLSFFSFPILFYFPCVVMATVMGGCLDRSIDRWDGVTVTIVAFSV